MSPDDQEAYDDLLEDPTSILRLEQRATNCPKLQLLAEEILTSFLVKNEEIRKIVNY